MVLYQGASSIPMSPMPVLRAARPWVPEPAAQLAWPHLDAACWVLARIPGSVAPEMTRFAPNVRASEGRNQTHLLAA